MSSWYDIIPAISTHYTTAAVVTDYWLTQHAFPNEEAQGLLQCSYSVATACQLQYVQRTKSLF